MEALTAVSVAALTVYDMIKAVQKDARITNIRLVEKHGGKTGIYIMPEGSIHIKILFFATLRSLSIKKNLRLTFHPGKRFIP